MFAAAFAHVDDDARWSQVDFAGNPPIRTTAVKAKGRDGLAPGWAQVIMNTDPLYVQNGGRVAGWSRQTGTGSPRTVMTSP